MSKAFVLVNTNLGSEEEVESALKKVEQVTGVYQVYGIYDVIVEIEAESTEKIKEIIFSKIRTLRPVRSTLTLIAVS